MTVQTFASGDDAGQVEIDGQSPADLAQFIDELAEMAIVNDGAPQPLAAGTFIMYPMPDGGVMFVTSVEDGPLAGIKHHRIPPGMIRAVAVLANGGGKLAALRALTGMGRKAIGDGR